MSEAVDIMEPPLAPWLAILRDFGVAALFIAMYLTTIFYFYKDLLSQKKELRETTERVSTALEHATRAIETSNDTGETVVKGLAEVKAQTSEFIAYLKGRDDGRNH
jgi:F0F1-type ATP synthase membrane subunit b/b'